MPKEINLSNPFSIGPFVTVVVIREAVAEGKITEELAQELLERHDYVMDGLVSGKMVDFNKSKITLVDAPDTGEVTVDGSEAS